jgi:predicted nucleic acid-binding protein
MLANLTAVLDACVLYPAPLRDLFMELAVRDLFRARWSAEIHDEWIRNLRAQRPDIDPNRLERTRELMDRHVRDGLVTGHMPLVPSLSLPDEDDRHVLAAAIRSDAEVIITKNLKHFPRAILESYGIEPLHRISSIFPGRFWKVMESSRFIRTTFFWTCLNLRKVPFAQH